LASERSFQKSDFWARKNVLPAIAPRPKSQTALRQDVARRLLDGSAVQNYQNDPGPRFTPLTNARSKSLRYDTAMQPLFRSVV
jgi:hypothetical protein